MGKTCNQRIVAVVKGITLLGKVSVAPQNRENVSPNLPGLAALSTTKPTFPELLRAYTRTLDLYRSLV